MALLHLLRLPQLQLDLSAVHIHHGLRGAEADADARFCQCRCEELGVALDILRPRPERRSGSLEADWREMRYRELEKAALRAGADFIATGHHRDDLVEGVLMQMLRGGSLRSMAGIHQKTGKIIRPLLPFSRQQLKDWLAERAFSWVKDSSNSAPAHLRNRVRDEALPCLENISSRIRRQLLALSSEIAAIEEWISGELAETPFIHPWSSEGVDAGVIEALPRTLQSRWLMELCLREGLGVCRRSQIEGLGAFLEGELDSLNLPSRWRLIRRRSRLYLEAPVPLVYNIALGSQTTVALPLPGWKVKVFRGRTASDSAWRLRVGDLENLRLRSPQRGDRLESGRKLSSILRKIHPEHLRWSWPILTRNDKILWIPGIAVEADDSAPEWIVEVEKPCRT